jgi:hypothetical protein
MKSRRQNAQLHEELIRHRRVVMLARVQDLLLNGAARGCDGAAHRCRLDELRASAHHSEELHLCSGPHDPVARSKTPAAVDHQLAVSADQLVIKAVVIGR